jgi:hypothetical protein
MVALHAKIEKFIAWDYLPRRYALPRFNDITQ